MKTYIILLFFMLLSLGVQAQQLQGQALIDSLLLELHARSDTDTLKAKLLHDIAFTFRNSELSAEKGLEYGFQSLELSRQLGWISGEASANFVVGSILQVRHDFEDALQYFLIALEKYALVKNKSGMAKTYGNLGSVYRAKSNWTDAIKCLESAIELWKELDMDKAGLSHSYMEIAQVYSDLSEFEISNQYSDLSLKLNLELNDKPRLANNYNMLGINNMRLSNFDESLAYYKEALKINQEIGRKHGISGNFNNMGVVYFDKREYTTALELVNEAILINIEIKNRPGLANNYNLFANISVRLADYPTAIEYYLKAITLHEELGNWAQISGVGANIGLVYYYLGDYEKTLEYFHRALDIDRRIGNRWGIASRLGNIAIIYKELKQYDLALETYIEALELGEALGYKEVVGGTLGNISEIYDLKGDKVASLDYRLRSIEVLKEIDDKSGVALSYFNLGSHYFKEGVHEEGFVYYEMALKLYREIGELEGQSSTVKNLSKVYSNLGKHQQALEYYIEFKTLQDSMFSVEKSIAIASLEAKRENELKDREIALLSSEKQVQFLELEGKKAQLALQNLEAARQMQAIDLLHKDNEIYLLDIGRKDQELMLSQLANEAQATQLELAHLEREVKVAELLRQKTIRQSMLAGFGIILLAGLVLFLFLMYRRRAKFREKVAVTELKALRAQMNPHFMFNALGSIHNFVMQNNNEKASAYLLKFSRLMRIILESSMKENIPLEEEIEALEIYMQLEAARMQHKFTFDLAISDKIDPSNTLIPPLLIQPFVENAIWHGVSNRSSPGHVSVKISKQGDILHCEIEDNGIGRKNSMALNKTQINKRESVGIKLILERIEILNRQKRTKGGVAFTDLEEGLRVDIELPMEEVY